MEAGTDAARGGQKELGEFHHGRIVAGLQGFRHREGIGAGCEGGAQGLADGIPLVGRKPGALQADAVGATPADGMGTGDHGEGRCIPGDHAATGDHGEAAYPRELVHGAVAGKDGALADLGVSSQGTPIDQDHIVAHDAVMADMTAGHQPHAVAEQRLLPFPGGAMDSGVLVELAFGTDPHSAMGTVVLVVLRFASENGAGTEDATWPEDCSS